MALNCLQFAGGPGAVGALPAQCSCRYHVAYLDEGMGDSCLGSGFQLKLKDLPGWTRPALQDVDSICFLELECWINAAIATTTFHVAYMNVRSSSWAQGAVDEVLPHLGCNPLRRGDSNSFLWFWWVETWKLVVLMGVEKTWGLQEDLGFVNDYLCVDRKFSDLRRERSPILPCLGCCLVCRHYNFGKMVRWMSFWKKWWNEAVREERFRPFVCINGRSVLYCSKPVQTLAGFVFQEDWPWNLRIQPKTAKTSHVCWETIYTL